MYLLLGRVALIPAFVILIYRAVDAYLMAIGWKHNVYNEDIIREKFAAAFPDDEGRYGPKPADSDVVVLLIGTRCNHPLGILAPGFKGLGDYFTSMAKTLEDNADEFDFLGMTSWLNAGDRATQSELMSVAYFKSPEGLHRFAHSQHHMDGWNWWSREVAKLPHLSLYHESYHAPRGHWEAIYLNSHVSGVMSTTHKVFDQASGQHVWASPMVDASKGVMRTSLGRMGKGADANEREKSRNP